MKKAIVVIGATVLVGGFALMLGAPLPVALIMSGLMLAGAIRIWV